MSDPISINVILPGSLSGYRQLPDGTRIDSTIEGFYSSGCKEVRPGSISRRASSSGWRDPTPWSHTIYRFYNPFQEGWWRGSSGTEISWIGDSSTFYYTSIYNIMPDLGSCIDRAINQALLKLSNQSTDVGENFAERKQADRMIGDRIDSYTSQLTGRYISKHRRDWRRVKRVSPFVRHGLKYPSSWLEFQYGIVPLLNDIHGAFNVIKGIDKDYDTFRVSAKGFASDNIDPEIQTLNLLPNFPSSVGVSSDYVLDLTIYRKVGAFVRLDYVLVNPALAELQKVGLVNPALLAWNLLPYSFVLDWALPVGNYLQSWTADLGLQFKGGTVSSMRKVRGVISNARPSPGNHSQTSITASGGELFGMDFKRQVFSSSPAPRMPHFKNPLSLHHTANALSLLAVALAK